jgi:hypothetical protein
MDAGDARDASPADGAPDANTEDAAADATSGDADAASGPAALLFGTTTDFRQTVVTTADLELGTVRTAAPFSDGDAVTKASGGKAFVLLRSEDTVYVMNAAGSPLLGRPIVLGVEGGSAQNPHDIVAVPGSSTAFVSLYNSGEIAVVDTTTSAVLSRIDLSAFKAGSDADGSPDPDIGLYAPSTNRVYFLIQRIDQTGFPIPCEGVKSLLVGIDPATRALADINGPAAGEAIELQLFSPGDMALSPDGNRLLIVANGCARPGDGGGARALHGIEAVNLRTGYSSVVHAPANSNFFSRLVVLGPGSALVESFDDSFNELWNRWDLTSDALGPALSGLPMGVVAESADTVLGIDDASTDAGTAFNFVRYRVSTGQKTVVAANPQAPVYSFVQTSALLR